MILFKFYLMNYAAFSRRGILPNYLPKALPWARI